MHFKLPPVTVKLVSLRTLLFVICSDRFEYHLSRGHCRRTTLWAALGFFLLTGRRPPTIWV